MRDKIYILWILCLLCSFNCFSQKDTSSKASIKVIARVQKDNITLRWGADNALAWKYANQHGYMVERYTLVKRGKTLSSPKLLKITQEPIKPAPLAEWEALAKKEEYGAIAAQALYGKTFEVNTKSNNFIQIANQSKELETRFSFAMFCADQSLDVANMMGLKLTDKFIVSGERYLYKVYAAIPKDIYRVDTGYVFVDADRIDVMPKPANLSAEFSDGSVMLSWDNIYEDIYSSYFIERSDDGGTNFKTINSDPYLNTSPEGNKKSNRIFMLDSLPENNKVYQYRVKGKSFFADFGPTSDIVQGKGVVKPKVVPVITGAKVIENKQVLLTWEFPKELDGKINGFKLASTTAIKAPSKTLNEVIPSEKRELLVTEVKPSNYFSIKAIDAAGNEYVSAPYFVQLKDNTPPAAPAGLKGKIDTLGVVRLLWKAGKDEDIEGYRVYKANSLNDEFTQVTNAALKDTLFTDTTIIHTLSKKLYYKIVAVDHHFNISKFSEILTLSRPDKVPPAPPVITNCLASDSGVTLTWIPSSSPDVVKHVLYRKAEGVEKWNAVVSFDTTKKIVRYTDKNIDKKTIYEYSLAAFDESGNKGETIQKAKAKRIDNFIRPKIEKIKAEADRENRNITLKWEYPHKEVRSFMIYRAEEGRPLKLYKTIPGENFIFVDTSVKIATKYTYVLKANFLDGGSSQFSMENRIEF